MRKIMCIVLAGVLLGLWGCGEAAQTSPESSTATTPAPTTTLPPMTEPATTVAPPPEALREGAVMPPLQGGAMLYTFPAAQPYEMREGEYEDYPVYYLGLVNDLGEVVAAPQFTSVQYEYNDSGKVIGLFAHRDRDITWYSLEGKAKPLPFQASEITSLNNGRYWIVSLEVELEEESAFRHGICDGLYDAQEEAFVYPMQEGLLFRLYSGMVFGHRYENKSFDSNYLSGFQWNPADGSTREFPAQWRCQGYFPENGWYEMAKYTESDVNICIVDQELNTVPALYTEWHIGKHFDGGNYLVIRSRYGESTETWADCNGTISELRFTRIVRQGGCYIAWEGGYDWDGGVPILFDGMLRQLHKAAQGEEFVMLYDVQADVYYSQPELIALLGSDGMPRKLWDAQTAKSLMHKGKAGVGSVAAAVPLFCAAALGSALITRVTLTRTGRTQPPIIWAWRTL